MAAATGPVGSTAGQLAPLTGSRVVAIAAGTLETQAPLDWGFDATVELRSPDFADALQAVAPERIDVYIENAGRAVW